MDLDEVRDGLEGFVREAIGSSARLARLTESDGHAGLTFLFDVAHGGTQSAYVIKLPPKGVRRRGNTDVLRQAPLLTALRGAGLPVPEVPWAYDDNDWFEVPFIVMERLPGRTFFVWDPSPDLDLGASACRRRWEQAAEWLARLHAFDWRAHLCDWEAPAALEHEIRRWERIYTQAPEPAWIAAAEATERALLDALPDGVPVGLFHGDYQPGNCLYEGERFCGIIDWELSGIGAQLLDLGWLCMIADERNWTSGWMPRHPLMPRHLCEIYRDAGGAHSDHLAWYQALAGYRLASISCLNVKLHRRGQRHDPIWEHNARSVIPMLDLARHLLAGGD